MTSGHERGGALEGIQLGINGVSLLSPLTGIGQYTYQLAQQMQTLLAHKPWLFYGTGWRQELRSAPLPGVAGIKSGIKRFVPQPYLVSRFIQQCLFSAPSRRHRIDLYHEPNFLAFRHAGPTVVTVHDLSWIRHPETQPPERVRILNRLMPAIVARAAHIIVPTDFVRGEVIDYYKVAPERVSTTLYGAGSQFRPFDGAACAPLLAQHGLEFGRYILAVGTLEPRKNLSTAIDAFSRLPDAVRQRHPLVIAGMRGWGSALLSPVLQNLLEKRQVILTGYVPQADLPLLYAGARMMVFPSLYEGFGLPPVEAMASGVPVVVSNRASLPEVVGEAAITVEALDAVQLAEDINNLLFDQTLHDRLREAGLLRAARFSWRQCAIETLTVYQKVIKRL